MAEPGRGAGANSQSFAHLERGPGPFPSGVQLSHRLGGCQNTGSGPSSAGGGRECAMAQRDRRFPVSSSQPGQEMFKEPVPTRKRAGMDQVRETILLVEDEDFVRQVTAEVLSFGGYQVFGARTASEAMRVFRQHGEKVQLLLTDVVLPGTNGRDLARDLRLLHPGLKTMFISGYPDNEVAKHSLEEPGVFYLPKPFTVESLMQKVRQVLAAAAIEVPVAKRSAGR